MGKVASITTTEGRFGMSMKLSEALTSLGRPVAYHPSVARIVGVKECVLLEQLVYWTGKQDDPEGWIYKSQEELTDETGLSKKQQRTARTNLKRMGLLSEKTNRIEHKMFYRVELEALNDLRGEKQGQVPDGSFPKCPTGVSGSAQRESRSYIHTETTTENIDSQFEECWETYGRYGSKRAALGYWKRLSQKDRDAIQKAVTPYLKCVEAGRSKKEFQGWINPSKALWSTDWAAALAEWTRGEAKTPEHPTPPSPQSQFAADLAKFRSENMTDKSIAVYLKNIHGEEMPDYMLEFIERANKEEQ